MLHCHGPRPVHTWLLPTSPLLVAAAAVPSLLLLCRHSAAAPPHHSLPPRRSSAWTLTAALQPLVATAAAPPSSAATCPGAPQRSRSVACLQTAARSQACASVSAGPSCLLSAQPARVWCALAVYGSDRAVCSHQGAAQGCLVLGRPASPLGRSVLCCHRGDGRFICSGRDSLPRT